MPFSHKLRLMPLNLHTITKIKWNQARPLPLRLTSQPHFSPLLPSATKCPKTTETVVSILSPAATPKPFRPGVPELLWLSKWQHLQLIWRYQQLMDSAELSPFLQEGTSLGLLNQHLSPTKILGNSTGALCSLGLIFSQRFWKVLQEEIRRRCGQTEQSIPQKLCVF